MKHPSQCYSLVMIMISCENKSEQLLVDEIKHLSNKAQMNLQMCRTNILHSTHRTYLSHPSMKTKLLSLRRLKFGKGDLQLKLKHQPGREMLLQNSTSFCCILSRAFDDLLVHMLH